MDIAISIVFNQIKTKYSIKNNFINFFFLIIYLISSIIYSYFISGLIENDILKKIGLDLNIKTVDLIGMTILLIILLVYFLENKSTQVYIFKNNIPLSDFYKFNISYFLQFIETIQISIFFFIFSIYFFVGSFDITHLYLLLSYQLFSNMITYYFSLLKLKKKNNFIYNVFILVMIISSLYMIYIYNNLLSIILIVVYISLFNLHNKIKVINRTINVDTKLSKIDSVLLILRNSRILTSLVLAEGFKIVFILAVGFKETEIFLPTKMFLSFMILMISSPLLLFNYAYNNIWGYYRKLWYRITLVDSDGKLYTSTIIKLLLIPVFIDFIISLIFFIKIGDGITDNIIIYFTILITLTMLSLIWSQYFPFYISKPLSMQPNTSIISSGASIVIIIISSLPLYNNLFYIINLVLIVISIKVIRTYNPTRNRRNLLFNKLYK